MPIGEELLKLRSYWTAERDSAQRWCARTYQDNRTSVSRSDQADLAVRFGERLRKEMFRLGQVSRDNAVKHPSPELSSGQDDNIALSDYARPV